jgi:hypothetical protein
MSFVFFFSLFYAFFLDLRFALQKGINDDRSSQTLDRYYQKATPSRTRTPLAPKDVQMLWLRFFIRKNFPLNLVSSPEFREAISATSSLGKEHRVGARTFMSTTLISEAKKTILAKLRVLLLQAVPGALSNFESCLVDYSCLISFFFSLSGSLALDSWKSKYQKFHLFGARFSFITHEWKLLNLVCLCDAGLIVMIHLFISLLHIIIYFHCLTDFVCVIFIDAVVEQAGLPVANDGVFGSQMISKALTQFEQNPRRSDDFD